MYSSIEIVASGDTTAVRTTLRIDTARPTYLLSCCLVRFPLTAALLSAAAGLIYHLNSNERRSSRRSRYRYRTT